MLFCNSITSRMQRSALWSYSYRYNNGLFIHSIPHNVFLPSACCSRWYCCLTNALHANHCHVTYLFQMQKCWRKWERTWRNEARSLPGLPQKQIPLTGALPLERHSTEVNRRYLGSQVRVFNRREALQMREYLIELENTGFTPITRYKVDTSGCCLK